MDRRASDDTPRRGGLIGRRSVLKGLGAGALGLSAGGALGACSSGIKGAGGSGRSGTITIGFITPLTGQLSGFGASPAENAHSSDQLPPTNRPGHIRASD